MKTVKTALIGAFIVLGQILLAQPPGGGPGGQAGPPEMEIPSAKQIEKMVSELAEEVGMDEAQEEQVLELYTTHFEEIEEMTEGDAMPEREEMEAHKAELEENVKAVLDDEQDKLYEAYLKKQEKSRPQRR